MQESAWFYNVLTFVSLPQASFEAIDQNDGTSLVKATRQAIETSKQPREVTTMFVFEVYYVKGGGGVRA